MKIIRQSLVHKTWFLGIIAVLLGVAFYALTARLEMRAFTFTAGQLLALLYVFFALLLYFFVSHVLHPLQKITRQMHAVLNGKKYRKIEDLQHQLDELGLLAKFFNSVIEGFEKVSADVIDRQRMSDELGFASKVQRNLLPKTVPEIPGLDLVVKTRPAKEVGGDNFDIITLGNSTLFYVGDATGHGMPAGLVMTMVNVLIHAFSRISTSTRDILVNVNKFLSPKLPASMFMTLVMLRWEHDSQKLFYAGCGHEHVLIYRAAERRCEAVRTGGIALGLTPDIAKIVKEQEIKLEPDDAVVLFTDGITEAKNATGEMFGVKKLCQVVEEHAFHGKAESIFRGVSKTFAEFVGPGYEQLDDSTLLVLKYNFKNVNQNKKLQLKVDTSGLALRREKPNWSWEG
jgi:serine phosphatase RsbU (regulator of sigma subunit)